jgi:hypothetical protein
VPDLPNFGTIPRPTTPFPPALDTLQRRVDAGVHIQTLLKAMGVHLQSERVPRDIERYMELRAYHPELSAYFCLEHGLTHRGVPGSPPIHWNSASRPLQPVAGAWDAIHTGNALRAVSYPPSLQDLPAVLWAGFQAAIDGSAFT